MVAGGLAAFAAGVGLGGSLIIAIGAQNAFVLRQGLARNHVFAVALTCVLCDVTLIAAGAVGFGSLVARFPLITRVAAWGGAALLLVYGALSFRSALHPAVLHAEKPEAHGTLRTTGAAVAATLAISLLNPHVYLDTVVLIGSIAAQYEWALRVWFAAGAMTASTVWFFGLAYGARLIAPLFERENAWRILDGLIAGIMWWIAATLILGQIG
jgi:L-lysine exporter family protein LysE/ArgO